MSYIKIAFISVFTCIVGVILFLLHNQWIIIVPRPHATQGSPAKIQKIATFFYPSETTLKKETQSLILSSEPNIAIYQLITEWLNFIHQEGVISKKVTLQSVALNAKNNDAYISLDITPFSKNQSTLSKLMLIEALLKTVESTMPSLQSITLLSNNKPLQDQHLDFAYPWPITGYKDNQPHQKQAQNWLHNDNAPFTLLIDPCGDAQHKGRTITDGFERTLAFQCAHLIKKALTAENPNIKVLVLQTAHEMIAPHQRATLANKKTVDLVLSLNFYQEHEARPRCLLYYYMRNSTTDFWSNKKNSLTLEPYDQAYKVSLAQSYTKAVQLKEHLCDASKIMSYETLGIPYKPLLGMVKPAIAIEMGIKNSTDLQTIVPALAQALARVILN